MKRLILLFFSLFFCANIAQAANYIASTATAGARLVQQGTVLYSASGTVVYNPGGSPLPLNPNSVCPTVFTNCRYGPSLIFKFVVITTVGGSRQETTFYYAMPDFSEQNSVKYNGDFNASAKAFYEKFGSQKTLSDSYYGPDQNQTNRRLEGVGICMLVSDQNRNQHALIDLNSCSFIKPTISCTTPNQLVLDHGNVQLGQVNGNRKTGSININCSGALSAKLLLLPDTINLASGLTSKITVNGTSAEKTIPLSSGANTISVESTLVDSGAKPGSFQGSTTLVISYQ